MQIKSLVAAAGVALLATAGAAQAGDDFDVLSGIAATAMSATELSGVIGGDIGILTFFQETNIEFTAIELTIGFATPPDDGMPIIELEPPAPR